MILNPKDILCNGVEIPEADAVPLRRAIDGSLLILSESVDMANQHGLELPERLTLTQIAADTAVQVYVAQMHAAALRDGLQMIAEAVLTAAPEIAGAISESSTDLGAALLDGLAARRGRRCRRPNS